MASTPRHVAVNTARGWARQLGASTQVVPPPGYVSLVCDDPPLAVMLLAGEDSPTLSGGVGGWENVARPQQTAMTVWNGVEPYTLELPLMLDGFAGSASVESTLRGLYAVAGGDPEVEPGIVSVGGVPWLPAERWVINQIDLADALRRSADFERVRQALTLTLVEYVPPQFIRLRKRALQGAKAKTKVVTAKGQTVAKLARAHHCKWTEVRDANRQAKTPKPPWKANTVLKAGSKVRVPVAKTKTRRARGAPRKGTHKGKDG